MDSNEFENRKDNQDQKQHEEDAEIRLRPDSSAIFAENIENTVRNDEKTVPKRNETRNEIVFLHPFFDALSPKDDSKDKADQIVGDHDAEIKVV